MKALTVVLPVYNALPHLPKAVDSILRQTYAGYELLVIDDGSTDGSRTYLDSIEALDSRVRVVHQVNQGLGRTLNISLEMCNTQYYARMDGDDIMQPERLQKQMDFLDDNSGVVLVGGQYEFMTDLGTVRGNPVPLTHGRIVERLTKAKAGLCHPAIMFRTYEAKAVGGYRIAGAGQDFDFFLRMTEVGHVANIPDVVLKYRISNNSTSFSSRSAIRCGAAYAIYTRKLRQERAVQPRFEEFEAMWKQSRGRLRKLTDSVEDISFEMYRKSLMARCSGYCVSAACYLGMASLLRPTDFIWQLRSRISSRSA